MPKLSIIVPVYNVEKYIRECLESIKLQTFTDYEVLLIDDGSSDNSGAICDEYATKDPRFKVFHKENGGVSSARNFGLDNAKGDWISFMDSDDYWTANTFLEEVFENDLTNVSLVRFGVYSQLKEMKWLPIYWGLKDGYYEKRDFIPRFFDFVFVWHNLYRQELLKNIRFNQHIKYSEDTLFAQMVLFEADKILVVNEAYYFYRKNEESATSRYITSLLQNILPAVNYSREKYLESGYYDKSIFCTFIFTKLHEAIDNELKKDNIKDLHRKIKQFSNELRVHEVNTWAKVFEGKRIWITRLLVKLRMYRALAFVQKSKGK